jgi:hypothetical protein
LARRAADRPAAAGPSAKRALAEGHQPVELRESQQRRAKQQERSLHPRTEPNKPPPPPPAQQRRRWLAYLDEKERAELDAVQDDLDAWAALGLYRPEAQKKYLAVPNANGERAQWFERLLGARNTEARLREKATLRMKREQAGLPPPRTFGDDRPWLAYLDETERAMLSAVQDDVKEWRRRGLHKLPIRKEYLAAPDPTGERAATLKRLQDAVNTEAKLRGKGMRRRKRVEAGKPLLETVKNQWPAYLNEKERAELAAVQDATKEWRQRGFDKPEVRKKYLAESDPTGERAATLKRLQDAANIEAKLRAKGMRRMNRVAAGKPPVQTAKKQLLAYLDEKERAELEAVQDDAKEWRQRGFDKLEVQKKYLAEPDPTGERAATFKRLRAALKTHGRLWETAMRRQNRAEAGMSPRKAANEVQPWLAFLDEQERAEVDAVQENIMEWRDLRLYNLQTRKDYLAASDADGQRAAKFKRLQTAVNTEARLRAWANNRKHKAEHERKKQAKPATEEERGSVAQGNDYSAPLMTCCSY